VLLLGFGAGGSSCARSAGVLGVLVDEVAVDVVAEEGAGQPVQDAGKLRVLFW
jgi:hypothetical protein